MKILPLVLFGALSMAPATAADLRVNVAGVLGSTGTIRIALFNASDCFPSTEAAAALSELSAYEGNVTSVFKGLQPGQYAVALYHDEHGNKKLGTGFLGVPAEGHGVSRNASAPFGPPDFTRAAIDVFGDITEITIELRY